MSQIIGIALGTIWRLEQKEKNRNILIDICREKKLDIDAIEITIGTFDQVNEFRLSDTNKNWLCDLQYVSIHAPEFKEDEYFNASHKKILDKIQLIYNKTKSSNVVFHPGGLPNQELLEQYDFQISIENLVKDRNVGIDQINYLKIKTTNFVLMSVMHIIGPWMKQIYY